MPYEVEVVTEAPPVPGELLQRVKGHLRVDHPDEDDLIVGYTQSALNMIDGTSGVLGRAFYPVTLRQSFDCFPYEQFELLYPPLRSIDQIQYVDLQGVTQTLPPETYEFAASEKRPGKVWPAWSYTWPSTRRQPRAVTVTWQAGYASAGAVPPAIYQAILLLIGHWYENREAVSVGKAVNEMPFAVKSLLAGHYARSFG